MDVHVESNGTVVERVGGRWLGARLGMRVLGEVGQPGKTRLYGSVHLVTNGAAPRRALELELELGARVGVGYRW